MLSIIIIYLIINDMNISLLIILKNNINIDIISIILIFFLIASAAKSAQFSLHS